MIVTNIRIEQASDNPSLAQTAVDACTHAMNMAGWAWSLASPHRMAMLMVGANRSLAHMWGWGRSR